MQLCSCAPAQSAPTTRPCFPSARGACPRVASLACRDRPVSTFKHSRRSEPIRLDSAGSSFLKFAKSQRSFRNIAKIIIYDDQEICYEIFFLLLLLTFFSVSAAAYEEITLTTAMYVFCHFLEFPGISVAQA